MKKNKFYNKNQFDLIQMHPLTLLRPWQPPISPNSKVMVLVMCIIIHVNNCY